jgi:melibiose permease/lactose/raffinose/galactose permease
MIFYPAITRKCTRKKLMRQLMLIGVVGYAVMLLPSLLLKTGVMKVAGFDIKFLLLTLGYMLANFGQYGFYLIMMISIMNTVEYNEYKHGTRDEGIVSSLRPFLTKLASALTVAIANITYISFNIIRFTNGIATLEQDANEGLITAEQKGAEIDALLQGVQNGQAVGLLLVMTVLPCALMFISYVLYKKRYKLDEDEYERICRELAVREAEPA